MHHKENGTTQHSLHYHAGETTQYVTLLKNLQLTHVMLIYEVTLVCCDYITRGDVMII